MFWFVFKFGGACYFKVACLFTSFERYCISWLITTGHLLCLNHKAITILTLAQIFTEATPKAIMRTMNVKGLTLFHLKSHLQVCFRFECHCPIQLLNCVVKSELVEVY